MPVIHILGGSGQTGPSSHTLTLTVPANSAATVWKAAAAGSDVVADATAADGSGTVTSGTAVTLTVTPAAGQEVTGILLHKTGDMGTPVTTITTQLAPPIKDGGTGTAVFTMPDFDVTATLVLIPEHVLTLMPPPESNDLTTWQGVAEQCRPSPITGAYFRGPGRYGQGYLFPFQHRAHARDRAGPALVGRALPDRQIV